MFFATMVLRIFCVIVILACLVLAGMVGISGAKEIRQRTQDELNKEKK